MSQGLIAFVGLIYLAISIEQFWKRDWNMGVIYFGYSVANVGLFRLTQ